LKTDTSQDPEYLEWASILTGTKDFGPCKTIAFYSDTLEAVVVYNAFDEGNCGISIATSSPKWATKLSLRAIFGYPFIQLGLNRVTATINASNSKSISLCIRLGFRLEGELKQYYENGNSAMIYGLTKDNCGWTK
jgi:RimJ/RimL family protein N-acetyltransferase